MARIGSGRGGLTRAAAAAAAAARYLPLQRAEWAATLEKQRALYQTFLREFITDTQQLAAATEDADGGFADPLGAGDSSGGAKNGDKWAAFFKDNETLSQIHKVRAAAAGRTISCLTALFFRLQDVLRLCPEFAFFQGSTDRPRRALPRY